MAELTIPSVLRERASLQPNEKAFTYVDYEQDWDGIAETVTCPAKFQWPDQYHLAERVANVSQKMRAQLKEKRTQQW